MTNRVLPTLLLATVTLAGVAADGDGGSNARVTLVYQHELPNVPGKSIKGVLVEYGPGGHSRAHTMRHPRSSTRPYWKERS